MSVLTRFNKLLHIWKISFQILPVRACWGGMQNWKFLIWISARGKDWVFMRKLFWMVRELSYFLTDWIFSVCLHSFCLFWCFYLFDLCLLLFLFIRLSCWLLRILLFFLFLFLLHYLLVSLKKLFIHNFNILKLITRNLLQMMSPIRKIFNFSGRHDCSESLFWVCKLLKFHWLERDICEHFRIHSYGFQKLLKFIALKVDVIIAEHYPKWEQSCGEILRTQAN